MCVYVDERMRGEECVCVVGGLVWLRSDEVPVHVFARGSSTLFNLRLSYTHTRGS